MSGLGVAFVFDITPRHLHLRHHVRQQCMHVFSTTLRPERRRCDEAKRLLGSSGSDECPCSLCGMCSPACRHHFTLTETVRPLQAEEIEVRGRQVKQ